MTAFLLTLLRHGFVVLAAYLATHGIADATTTQGLVMGVCLTGVVAFASWIGKMMKFDEAFGKDPAFIDGLRTALGALISQGITFASSYYAINANDPAALGVAVINAVASHYGVQQQIAHATPIKVAAALKALVVCGSVLLLSSCATTEAFLASPFGRATLATADQLAKQVIATTERVGLEQIIAQADAKVSALKAGGADADPVKEALRIAQIAGFAGVIEAAQMKYEQLTGRRYTRPKSPVNVQPLAARQNRLKPELHNVPASLLSANPLRHAPDDAQGDPAMLRISAMKQSGVSIPLYGQRVAFLLSTAAIAN